ncbi:MAG: DnaA/Hda family protein, partial [Phyllobacterium sp.]|uniref:DnaA ATPase domain-containing protein n=1 Tax=Phyllobacterium sp. TaxID=1871046 RepID=UPI0030F1876A
MVPLHVDEGKDMASAGGEMIFERVKSKLKAKLGGEVYSSWFGRLKLDETSKSIVRLSVPTAFLRSWINNHYSDMITALWREEDEQILKVEIVFRSASRAARPTCDAEAPQRAETRALAREKPVFPVGTTTQEKKAPAHFADRSQNSVFGSPLDPRYTFETFVDGTPNRVALAAARTIADAGASAVRFNPLFIHASVGLGKTHLLQAIAAE